MRDAYIVTSIRTPGCRRNKGAFRQTRPDDLLGFILDAAIRQTPNLKAGGVEDVMTGCAFPEAEQGLNIGRNANQIAGFPVTVGGATVNRFCASGLEAIALASLRVMAGWSDIAIGSGVESMTIVPMGGSRPRPHPEYAAKTPGLYASMGITAENVANRYDISRKDQDEFAFYSHKKATHAQANGLFTEIVPTPATRYKETPEGLMKKETFLQDFDDGVRNSTTLEGLARLRPAFSLTGSVTAGNSSQTTDGAAATIVMSGDSVKKLGLTPLARIKCYTTVGCEPDEMGVGPKYAIPAVLKRAGMTLDDIDLIELNEAFASQALHCSRVLDLDLDRVNIHGGAIALGHPLGCTGAKLVATMIANLKERKAQHGLVSMCMGGGMGAAAIIELL